MRPEPSLLVDVGSTVVKSCTRYGPDRFSHVEVVAREVGVAPGVQVSELIERRRRVGPVGAVRVCSSANGGIRVGVLGLSRRHSIAAAVRAVLAGGGDVVYRRALGEDGPVAPPVDVLVLVGGVDGADPGRLLSALPLLRLDRHPHRILVWAGADEPAVVAALPPHLRAGNVLDADLRPAPTGLAETIRAALVDDLADAKGLSALDGLTDGPIWPTPVVVGLSAERMTREPVPPAPTTPFVVVDAGGATTDVFACAELRGGDGPGVRTVPGESVVRHVFPDLGVASSASALLHRLAVDPELMDVAAMVAPRDSRAFAAAVIDGDPGVLAPPAGFLACLALALRRVADLQVDLGRASGFVITGGAWRQTPPDAIRRVVDAVRGPSVPPARVLVDRTYSVWAYGIQQVPATSDAPPQSVGNS